MNERDLLKKDRPGPKLETQEIAEQDKACNSKPQRETDVALSQSKALQCELEKLRPFVKRVSTTKFDPLHPYPICLRYAFCRAFSFAETVSRQKPDDAFFLIPALRPITEDIIFFRFLFKSSSDEDRDMVITNLMHLDVLDKLKHQQGFFLTFRPFQRVLTLPEQHADMIDVKKEELLQFWRRKGWPSFGTKNKRAYVPPIREMAQKSDPGLLEVVYDFIYRLASGEVHSTPRTLLRLGWGESISRKEQPLTSTFSTTNLGPYHLNVIQVYGTYILCIWSELFGDQIDVSKEDHDAFSALRKHLMSRIRWPEMVTPEEMNQPVPDPVASKWPNLLVHALYSVIMNEGFISGAKTLLKAPNDK